MALQNADQQGQIDAAMARAKAQGIDETTAQNAIKQRLSQQGYTNQGGTLVKPQQMPVGGNSAIDQYRNNSGVDNVKPQSQQQQNVPQEHAMNDALKASQSQLSPGEYNAKAQKEGRSDWSTAYRSDVMGIKDAPTVNGIPNGESTSQPTQPNQQPTNPQPQGTNPTSPQTNVEKTTTTTPQGTTTVAKETPKLGYNVGAGREQEILDNLNEGAKNDQNAQQALQNGDVNAFRKMYGYDNADQTKKNMIDAFFQAKQPKTADSFLQILASGGKIQNSQYANSPEAAQAQHIYDLIGQYKGANSDTLYASMVNGNLAPGSEPYNDLVKLNGGVETPDMIAAKQKYQQKLKTDQLNRDAVVVGSAGTGSKPPAETPTTIKVSDNVVSNKGMDYAQEFKNKVAQNPELVDLSQQVNSTDKQIKDLEADKALTIKKISAAHPGLPTGLLFELANEQNAPINEQITKLQNDRAYLASNLQYKTDLAQKTFDYEVQQDQANVAYQRQQAQIQQQQGFTAQQAQNQRDFERQQTQSGQAFTAQQTKAGQEFTAGQTEKAQDFQKQMFGIQQAYANPDINSSDPNIARIAGAKAVQSELAFAQSNGIPVTRSEGQIMQDAQNYAQQNNVTLGQSLQETFTKPLHAKQEYQQAMTNIQSKSAGEAWKSTNVTTYNPQTGMSQTSPVFYRTKGAGGFEVVDASGNPMNPSVLNQSNQQTQNQSVPSTPSNTPVSGNPPLTGANLVKALASGKYQGSPFFGGPYATGDANGTQRAGIYATIAKEGLENYYNRVAKGAPVTLAMINSAAQRYSVDPIALAAFVQADSNFGNNGLGAKNNNPFNVGQFDSLGTTPVAGYSTLQQGVDAGAANLASRTNALISVANGGTPQTNTQAQAGQNPNTDKIVSLFTMYQNAPANARAGQPNKNAYLIQMQNLGVKPQYLTSAIQSDKYLSKSDPTAFEHLNMLEDLVKQLPATGNKLTASVAQKVLDFFGDPTQANSEMMQGLAGDELSKFYGANGVSDRAKALEYFSSLPRDTMISQIDQARKASATKAESENQKYKQALGIDHPTFTNIMDTIGRKNSAFNSGNQSSATNSTGNPRTKISQSDIDDILSQIK